MGFAVTEHWMIDEERSLIARSRAGRKHAGLAFAVLLHAGAFGLLLGRANQASSTISPAVTVFELPVAPPTGDSQDVEAEGELARVSISEVPPAAQPEQKLDQTASTEWTRAWIRREVASVAQPAEQPAVQVLELLTTANLAVSVSGAGAVGVGASTSGRGSVGFDPYAGAAPVRWKPEARQAERAGQSTATGDQDALRQRLHDAFPEVERVELILVFSGSSLERVELIFPRLPGRARNEMMRIVREVVAGGGFGSGRQQLAIVLRG